MIIGKAALVLVDVQQGIMDQSLSWFDQRNVECVMRIKTLVDACRDAGIPPIFIKEVHRTSMIDFGRELDGNEKVHCLDGNPNTEVASVLDVRPGDVVIPKPRYSAFHGTDIMTVLNGYGVFPGDTLIMCGYLSDVCVHYTFVDAHQRDFRIKVVEDCSGGSTHKAHDYAFKAMKYLQKDAPCQLEDILKEIAEYKQANQN